MSFYNCIFCNDCSISGSSCSSTCSILFVGTCPVTQSCVSFFYIIFLPFISLLHTFLFLLFCTCFLFFMPTIKRPDHRAFYSYHKLAGTTFPIYLLPFLPQPYSYRISCSMTMPDWNCISSFSLDSTLMVEISRLTRSLSNSGIWQVLVPK